MYTSPLLAPARLLTAALASAAITITLAACDPASPATPSTSVDNPTVSAAAPAVGGDAPESSNGTSTDFIVLPGTGSYAIGTEAPIGGYQLQGEPSEQPAGCTWAIEDADGNAAFANQGQYVFLTDIKEAVTFVTNGCPDWEQFE